MPALGAAVAMNLFGHGIALSGDYIIQGAPKLTADAAGLPVSSVMQASIPLVAVMGIVTTVSAFWMMKRDQENGTWRDGLVASPGTAEPLADAGTEADQPVFMSDRLRKGLAIAIPLLFLLDVIGMFVLHLQGGDATALVGGPPC